jgi:3-deoxy-D-manno-octulosonate 8-phosphate phosphatase (KDO 8-P phosphatase)
MDALRQPGGADADARTRAQRIRVLALDVDGTMTDGTLYIGPGGEAMKGFSVRDGFGLALLREAGIRLAIVTARQSEIVLQRAAELKFDAVLQRVHDKAQALAELAARFECTADAVAYMGDDWPDLPALRAAGLAAAPADAAAPVIAQAHWVSSRPAGHGAVREFAEWLLASRGELDALVERHRGA